jgi:hypothetical protein
LLFSLKDVMVQFIKTRRLGKEIILDLKVGYLHAYSNARLLFGLHRCFGCCLDPLFFGGLFCVSWFGVNLSWDCRVSLKVSLYGLRQHRQFSCLHF